MKRIFVDSGESPGYRRAREQRASLDRVAAGLFNSWPERTGDPLAVEILRGIAVVQSLDDDHPVNRHGECRRWRCTRRWFFIRRSCPIRIALGYYRNVDEVMLWFHILSQILSAPMSLAAIRVWLTACHTETKKLGTEESDTAPRPQSHTPTDRP